MTRRVLIGILVVVVLAAGAVGVGAVAYRAGMMQGLVTSGQVVVPQGDGTGPGMWFFHNGPMMGYGHMGWGGWGFGAFGLLRCLVPLFGLFLLFALLRLVIGPRRWGWGGYGRWGGPGGPGMRWSNEPHSVPPGFEEWHRRAHGEAPPPTPPAQPGQ
jgi:hypothetical protein